LARVDQVLTDDAAQLEHSKSAGYFVGIPKSAKDVADVVAGKGPGRTSSAQRIVGINMGIALEDVASALVIYRRARELDVGTELPV
jgi:ornithine cyclodeaminase/alanine dehydrogenase-like protein (mu-crystallin family)